MKTATSCPFELGEILNIFPVKKVITVCKIVIPEGYIKIKPLKNQTILSCGNSKIADIISNYFDNSHIIVGHKSFHNDWQYVLGAPFYVKSVPVLPEGCGLVKLVITAHIVEGFDYKITQDLDNALPFEDTYIIERLDDKDVTNNK